MFEITKVWVPISLPLPKIEFDVYEVPSVGVADKLVACRITTRRFCPLPAVQLTIALVGKMDEIVILDACCVGSEGGAADVTKLVCNVPAAK